MGRKKVIEILLNSVENAESMMKLKDGRGRTGFMQACEFGKTEIVELLLTTHLSFMEDEDMYMAFKSACSHSGKKVIHLLMKNDSLRPYILRKEETNLTRNQSIVSISKQFEWRNDYRKLIISFNERDYPVEPIVSSCVDNEGERGHEDEGPEEITH